MWSREGQIREEWFLLIPIPQKPEHTVGEVCGRVKGPGNIFVGYGLFILNV
jgi:hypothetical protein